MSEVLSQEEIDSLLTAISSGDVKADEIQKEGKKAKVKPYDFKRPEKFSRDQLRNLRFIHEAFARLSQNILSTFLRSIVNLSVVSVDQLTYKEFMSSINPPTVISVFSMGRLEGNCIFEINLSIVFVIIDRLFGGIGENYKNVRPLTDIEEAVITKVIEKFLKSYKESWVNVIPDLNPRLELIESNPQFVTVAGPNDICLLITLEVNIDEAEGIINICIPYMVIESVVDKLNAQTFIGINKEDSSKNIVNIQKKLEKSKLDVIVELGRKNVFLRDLLALKAGDYIELNSSIKDKLKVRVQDEFKFLARPGVFENNYSVEITDVIQDEELLDI
jgi:flagellar motor switch protein FliM